MSEHVDVSKCTPGLAKVVKGPLVSSQIVAHTGGDYSILVDGNVTEHNEKHDALLIAEAFTVASETGKSPRQLADERDYLLGVLNAIIEEDGAGEDGIVDIASTAIARVTGQKGG